MTPHNHKSTHTTPLELFCSYTSEDQPLFRQLEQRLAPLQRAGRLILRHRGQIVPGADVETTIKAWETQASTIVLLVSPAYLASDTCHQQAQQAVQGSAHVIPVILRPCDWSMMPFAGLQCLPRNGRAITTWDNKDQGWQEVVKGIRLVLEEAPVSNVVATAKITGQPRIWNVPFARNPFFTGRDELLERLHTQLHTTQTAAVSQPQAISGLGGIGKTALAVEYAYKYGGEYQAILWARADTTETLNASYTEIAMLLNLPQRNAKEQDVIVQAVKSYFSSHGGWLLILDNADEPDVLTSFFPSKAAGQVLVTTRAADLTDLGLGFQHALAVETFTIDQGALFLLHRSALLPLDATLDQAENEAQQRALAIAQELGSLPLALDQAGAYISKTGCGLAVYQQIYEKHRTQLLKERRSTEHPESVATTWLISFEQVEKRNPAAADLLRFFAFLAPDAIPEEILTEGAKALGETLSPVSTDPLLLNEAIESLRAYSLMSREAEAKMLSVHRLVQAVVRDSMPIEIQRQWMQRAVETVDASNSGSDFAYWPAFERLLPHVLTCATWITQISEASTTSARLLNRAGEYLFSRARYAEAEPMCQHALAIREQLFGAEHPEIAQSLNGLAELYRAQGRYAQAEPLYIRALTICEQLLGAEHPETAQSLSNLALLYKTQGKYIQAEPLLQRALAIFEQQFGSQHPNTARNLDNLALLYRNQGKYTQAEPLYLRALAIWEQHLGNEHPDTAISLNNLATLYGAQGKYEQAEPLFQRAIAIKERTLGADHPSTAASLSNLAGLYYKQEKYAQAEPVLQRALAICELAYGANHPDTAEKINNLAELYRAQSKYEQAEPLFQRAIAIKERTLEANHPSIAVSFNNLALLYHQQGKYEQAEPLYQRSLVIQEHVLGLQHPLTRFARSNYADLLRAIGRNAEAKALEKKGDNR